MHEYEVRPRKDKRGVDLISYALPFSRLWYGEPNAISYAEHCSRSHDAVIRVYDEAGNVIETHEHAGVFKEWSAAALLIVEDDLQNRLVDFDLVAHFLNQRRLLF
jgi:hypothetical protein